MMQTGSYSHTQKGIIMPILATCAVICACVAAYHYNVSPLCVVFAASAATFAVFCPMFASLTVKDAGDHLIIAFGPVSLFKKSVPYSDITGVERDKSTFLSGWGIHWTSKGWLWNIGGYDCVRIKLGDKGFLIGTDDPEGLVKYISEKMNNKDI